MIEGRPRLVEAAGFAQDYAVIQQNIGIVRIGLQRAADQVQRLAGTTLLSEGHTQWMADLRIARMEHQQFQEAPFGLDQVAMGQRGHRQVKEDLIVHGFR